MDELINFTIHFLKDKSDILKRLTDCDEFIEEDYEDIRRWKVEDVIVFFERLYDKPHIDILDNPWCSKYYYINRFNCTNCTYKERHGKCDCNDSFNTYGYILNTLVEKGRIGECDGICKLKEIAELLDRVKELSKVIIYRRKLKSILR